MNFEDLIRQKLEEKIKSKALEESKTPVDLTQEGTLGRLLDDSSAAGASVLLAAIRRTNESTFILQRNGDITRQQKKVKAGDLSGLENSLVAQSFTLQSLYNQLATIAVELLYSKSKSSVEHFEAIMRIALKAQNQSRQTIATLAELKNPKKAVFIRRQQNLTISPSTDQTPQLEAAYGSAIVDTRAEGAPAATDPGLEALAEVNGTSHSARESAKRKKQSAARS